LFFRDPKFTAVSDTKYIYHQKEYERKKKKELEAMVLYCSLTEFSNFQENTEVEANTPTILDKLTEPSY